MIEATEIETTRPYYYHRIPDQFKSYVIDKTFSERAHLCLQSCPAEIVATGASVSRGKLLTDTNNFQSYITSFLKWAVKPDLERLVLNRGKNGDIFLLDGPMIDVVSAEINVRGGNRFLRFIAPEFVVNAEYFASMNATVYRKPDR